MCTTFKNIMRYRDIRDTDNIGKNIKLSARKSHGIGKYNQTGGILKI